jgi:hypothetical protein
MLLYFRGIEPCRPRALNRALRAGSVAESPSVKGVRDGRGIGHVIRVRVPKHSERDDTAGALVSCERSKAPGILSNLDLREFGNIRPGWDTDSPSGWPPPPVRRVVGRRHQSPSGWPSGAWEADRRIACCRAMRTITCAPIRWEDPSDALPFVRWRTIDAWPCWRGLSDVLSCWRGLSDVCRAMRTIACAWPRGEDDRMRGHAARAIGCVDIR